jgi:hypothetical protein
MLEGTARLGLALAAASAIVLSAADALAQQHLSLDIRDGRVSLVADNVTLRDILKEWQRVTGAVIVNGDKIDGPPITLRLIDLSERAALGTLLRNVSGYVLAQRPDSAAIDRIVILPGRPPASLADASRVPAAGATADVAVAPGIVVMSPQRTSANGTNRPREEAAAVFEQPGVASENSVALNQPTTSGTANGTASAAGEDDLSRYDGVRGEDTADKKASTVPPNPFGIREGSATPGMPQPPRPQQTPRTR